MPTSCERSEARHEATRSSRHRSRPGWCASCGNPRLNPLSDRELEVLRLIASGETNRGAAALLFISEATVKTHLIHIYGKLGVSDRAAAVAVAYERGLLVPGRD